MPSSIGRSRGRPIKRRGKCKGKISAHSSLSCNNTYEVSSKCEICGKAIQNRNKVRDEYSDIITTFPKSDLSKKVTKKLCTICHNHWNKFKALRNELENQGYPIRHFKCIVFNSNLCHGRRGLFALKNYKVNEVITLYNGDVLDFHPSLTGNYLIDVEYSKRLDKETNKFISFVTKVIDGDPSKYPMNLFKLAAYANDSRSIVSNSIV
jgi:hypothetical protein